MPKPAILIMAALLSVDSALAAESHHGHHQASPYAGEQTRDINALSQEDVDELLRGGGWGLAKAAEMNGMPVSVACPRHGVRPGPVGGAGRKDARDTRCHAARGKGAW